MIKYILFICLLQTSNIITFQEILDSSKETNLKNRVSKEYITRPSSFKETETIRFKRDEILPEISEEVISDDPGYNEAEDEDIDYIDYMESSIDNPDETAESLNSIKKEEGMLEGFDGLKDPLPFDREIEDEERYFGKLEDSETEDSQPTDMSKRSLVENEFEDEKDEETEEMDTDENIEEIENDSIDEMQPEPSIDEESEYDEGTDDTDVVNEKRSNVADLESNILGSDVNDIDDIEEGDESAAEEENKDLQNYEALYRSEDNSNLLSYDKLLSEFEGDTDDVDFFENGNRASRSSIPEPELNIENEEKYFSDEFNDDELTNNFISEQTCDSHDSFFDNEESDPSLTNERVEDSEETDNDLFCDATAAKKNVIEYNDYMSDNEYPEDTKEEKISEFHDDALEDEPDMNFDCSECVDVDSHEPFEKEDGFINSKVTCPDYSDDSGENRELFAKNIIFNSNLTNSGKKSMISDYDKEADFLCNEKCQSAKRSLIYDGLRNQLASNRLWSSVNSEIKYHRIPRSSVGILIDGNIRNYFDVVENFALNLALLFSRDSAITLGVYRECLKTVDMPNQIMMNPLLTYEKYFAKINSLIKDRELGKAGQRNAHWALSDMSKSIVDKAKFIDTKLKIQILITNGPMTNTGLDDANLKIIKRQNKLNDVRLYIVQLGSNYKMCQFTFLTYTKRILIVHHVNQLIYGGRSVLPSIPYSNTTSGYVIVGSVMSILQSSFARNAKLFVPAMGKILYFKGGYVGWSSDIKSTKLAPIDTSNVILPNSRGVSTTDDLFNVAKKDEIEIDKRARIRRVTRRITRPANRTPPTFLVNLRKDWYWNRRFPSLQTGVLSPANVILMMDTMNGGMMPVMQKLLYYTAIPFPVTLSKITIFGLSSLRYYEFCRRKTFSRAEDVQRIVTTIPSTRGKALSISQHLLRIISPSSRIMSIKMNNVVFIILTHRTVDFAAYNYAANIVKAARLQLYIYGIGLADQAAFFGRLTQPNRVFTSVTRSGFFTRANFNKIIRQLKADLGTSKKVLNLDSSAPAAKSPIRRISRVVSRLTKPIASAISRRIIRRKPSPAIRKQSPVTRKQSTRQRRITRTRNIRRGSPRRTAFRKPKRSRKRRLFSGRRPRRRSIIRKRVRNTGRGASAIIRGLRTNRRGKSRVRPQQRSRAYTRQRSRASPRQRSRTSTRQRSRASTRQRSRASPRQRPKASTRQRPRASPRQIRRPSLYRQITKQISKLARVGRPLSIRYDGVVGPTNIAFVVDATFGSTMPLIRSFLKDFIRIFQREGTFVTISSFGVKHNLHVGSTQFASQAEISTAVDRIKGSRSTRRNTGQALMETRRILNTADPNYPLIVVVLLNGPSSDDYRVPSTVLREDGVKVITLNGRNVPENETLRIQSSSQLSFRTNFAKKSTIISKLLPLFRSICGRRISPLSTTGKNYMSSRTVSKQWGWKTFGSSINYNRIAGAQISALIDTTMNPDSIVKMLYNIMRSFSTKSRYSIRTIGLTDTPAYKLAKFKSYQELFTTQLVLQGLIGNSVQYRKTRRVVRRRINRRVVRRPRPIPVRRRRRGKRDTIEELFTDENLFSKRQRLRYPPSRLRGQYVTGTRRPILNTGTSRLRATSSINPTRITGLSGKSNNLLLTGTAPRNAYLSGARRVPNRLGTRASTRLGTRASTRLGTRASTRLGTGVSNRLGTRVSNRLGTRGRTSPTAPVGTSSLSTVNNFDYLMPLNGLSGTNPSGSASANKAVTSGAGNRRVRKALSRINSASGTTGSRFRGSRATSRPTGSRQRTSSSSRVAGRNRLQISRRIPIRGRALRRISSVYYRRTWRALTLRLRRIAIGMRISNKYGSYGPNKNKMVILLLSGWPYNSKKIRVANRLRDGGFSAAARNITSLGIRLIIIVMQSRKTRDRFAQPILRAASTYFLHGSWGEAQSDLVKFQRTSRRLLGAVGRPSFGLKYSGFKRQSKFRFSIIPSFGQILPPPYETYMTTNYLINVQNLRKTTNWRQIVPGLRPNHLRGSLNVIFAIDVSKNTQGTAIKNLVMNMLRLFHKRFVRFSLVLVSRTSTIDIQNYYANNVQRMNAFVRRVRFNRVDKRGPLYGSALNLIETRLIPRLTPARRNLVIFVAHDRSRNDVKLPAARLHRRGTTISAIGIGNTFNIPELQAMCSSGQLLAVGEISMLPIILYRLQFAYSLVINGPKVSGRSISLSLSSYFRPQYTVFRTKNNDSPRKQSSLAAKNIYTSKRDEIYQNSTDVKLPQNVTTDTPPLASNVTVPVLNITEHMINITTPVIVITTPASDLTKNHTTKEEPPVLNIIQNTTALSS